MEADDLPFDYGRSHDRVGAVELFAGLSFDYSAAPPVSIRRKRTLLVLRRKKDAV